jgi:hypothetical protein
MKRVVTVEFGPSRSKRFAKAVAEAEAGVGELSELLPASGIRLIEEHPR